MGRNNRLYGMCLAVAVLALPTWAGDNGEMREELDKLRQEVHVMRTAMLEKEIDGYLADTKEWQGLQGGGNGLSGVAISARGTTVYQGALGTEPADTHSVDGDFDVNFDFTVTDNTTLFAHMTANTGGDSFSRLAGISFDRIGAGFPNRNGEGTTFTYGDRNDGIGINGTVSTSPGSVRMHEAGVRTSTQLGGTRLHWEFGKIDPRSRFMQNRFTDDENTQFINNIFDDSSSILWLTDRSGRIVFGWHMWLHFGENQNMTLSWGWFNTPGRFFNSGQFFIQFHYKGELRGREMNLRLTAQLQEFFRDGNGDGDAGAGVSWDWMMRDDIGVFLKIGVNGDDVSAVELDVVFGFVFNGLISSRPDDVFGIGIGFLAANETVVGTAVEDSEFTFEIYYKYMADNGKMQITPHVIYISDPSGGDAGPSGTDNFFILGIRFFVPF